MSSSPHSWIRRGYHAVNAYIVVDGVEPLIAFLCDIFGGSERGERELRADGGIDHAEVLLGDSVIMLSDASVDHPARPCVNFVYVEDVDAVFRRAVDSGATHGHEPADRPWGDRVAGFHDPFDNRWWVATCVHDDAGPAI
jgi:PhnB protein